MSGTGQIVVRHIFIAASGRQPMQEVASVMALAGIGLEGDRYASGIGTWSQLPRKVLRHATVIALADIEAANTRLPRPFLPSETRRNIVLDGISPDELNALANGAQFQVGEAVVRGIERCLPCEHPSKLTNKPGFDQAFQGGLRVEIVKSGRIAKGDALILL